MIILPQICSMWSRACRWRWGQRTAWAGAGVAQCATISAQTRPTWRTTLRKTTWTSVTSVQSAAKNSDPATLLRSTSNDCTTTSPSVVLSAQRYFHRGRRWKPTWKATRCSRSWRKATHWCSKCWCRPHPIMQNKISRAFNQISLLRTIKQKRTYQIGQLDCWLDCRRWLHFVAKRNLSWCPI